MEVLIRGGRLVDPAQGLDGLYDLLLKGGKIADVLVAGNVGFSENLVRDKIS